MSEPASPDYFTGPKCISSNNIKHMLHKAAPKKNEQYGRTEPEGNSLITNKVLREVFSKGKLVTFLGCLCSLCGDVTRRTKPAEDEKLAELITRDIEHQRLIASLAFMGGLFAARSLDKYGLNSIDKVEANMQDRLDLCRELFAPFKPVWDLTQCRHESPHATRDYLLCLAQSFQDQFKAKRWVLNTPKFEADNLLRNFGERQNMPFIHETLIGRTEPAPTQRREYVEFKIHPEYCDEQLRDRVLFRKQTSTDTATVHRRAEEERDILKFLKELAHPYIAPVLFAFQENEPPQLSLIFEHQPTDLQKVLYLSAKAPDFNPPRNTSGRFQGSKLDDWRWEGMLGIFDAVAAVHFPLEYSTSIPIHQSNEYTLIGGHFDIKPANIIINHKGQFLLTDFGQAYFKREKKGEATNLTINPGTFNYMPPSSYSEQKAREIGDIIEKKRWTREYDVWSLACVTVEVIASIIDGDDAPGIFKKEREEDDEANESQFIKCAKFWITQNGQETLKNSVQVRLHRYRCKGDDYLARVAGIVEGMFQVQRAEPKTVTACQQELSASVKKNRYIFMGRDDVHVAHRGTRKCLEDMLTSFTTDRVAPLHCSLHMWKNERRDRLSLTIEFPGSESNTIVKPDSRTRASDALIPISLFDTDVFSENYRFRPNSTPLQFAFRNLHDGITFHISRRSDYYYILGAFTHQLPMNGSEQHFRRCVVVSRQDWKRSETTTSLGGQLQIWRTLDSKTYKWYYSDTPAPSIPDPLSPSADGLSASSGTTQNLPAPAKLGPGFYVLCLFLCDQDVPKSNASSNVQKGKSMVVVSLYDDTFDCSFKRNPPRMLLERKPQSDIKKIHGTIFKASAPADSSISSSPSHQPSEIYPGITLSVDQFNKRLEKDNGFKKIEVEFGNDAALDRFETYYRKLFPR